MVCQSPGGLSTPIVPARIDNACSAAEGIESGQ
jgi:hypothetical protein